MVQTRLRNGRKLTLVLDLDHTLIHAVNDPAIACLASSHPALRDRADVHMFSDGPVTFTVKLRPGLAEFLETVR